MVAQFLRLKLALLANTFRRSPIQVIGMLIGLAVALVVVLFITGGLFSLRSASEEIARAIVIVFGTVVSLAFLLVPLSFGVDDPLDPRRFALLGIPAGPLARGIALAALVSVPTVVVALFAIGQVGTWSRDPALAFWAIVALIIIVPTAVLSSRVASAVASLWLSRRRARDATGIALLVVIAVSAPLLALFATMDWESRGLPIVRRIAAVVTWTPFGAAWSIPGDFADERAGSAIPKLIIALVYVLVLWVAWRVLVGFMVTRPLADPAARDYTGLGWFARLPATPTGVIAARSLSYWTRDARYRTAVAVLPVLPIVIVITLLIAGIPGEIVAWIPVPVMCLFLGWSAHNDLASDSSAFWVHVSANTRGIEDRLGRIVPALLLGIPLAIVGGLVSGAVVGAWEIAPGVIGLALCLLFAGLGISSVVSATSPYPAVLPGDSPFAQPQAAGNTGAVVQAVSFFATLVVGVPVILLALPGLHWLAFVVGLVLGGIILVAGLVLGGRVVDRRAPELLAFTLQN